MTPQDIADYPSQPEFILRGQPQQLFTDENTASSR